jgi:hypothetical protein
MSKDKKKKHKSKPKDNRPKEVKAKKVGDLQMESSVEVQPEDSSDEETTVVEE